MPPDPDLDPRIASRIGTVVRGKYRLDSVLGVGGMATVYKATHRNKAEFALKMLHPDLCARPNVRTRFLREGYSANSVKHPGAVRVVDDDVAEDGSAFLVMELLDGASADHLIEPPFTPPSPSVVAAIGLQLLEVLAAAHTSGIVHRDIKPANLFLTRDGTVKVLDFGIARALDDTAPGAQQTGAGAPIGTPTFMAPEQALGRSGEIDARTDVWGAGATLFALATGETVHRGSATAEVLVAAATVPARSLSLAAPQVPAPIAQVIDRALAFDRNARWGNAGEMRDALAAACAAAAIPASDKSEIALLFQGALVSEHSRRPEAFAPTVASVPSLPGTNSSRLHTTAPPLLTTGRSHPGPAKRRPRGLPIALALVAIGAAAAGVGFWHAHAESAAGPAASSVPPASAAATPAAPRPGARRTQVLVLAVDNATGDPLFDGTIDMILARAISRSSVLSGLPTSAVRSLAADLDAGTEALDERVARRALARDGGRVVSAHVSIAPKDAGYTLTLKATDAATGAVVFNGSREAASGARVVPAIGRLACDVRAALGDKPPADPAVAEQTGMSPSIEADHEVIIGSALVNTGKYDEAVVYLRRAVTIDPRFGKGHWILGNVLENMGDHAASRSEYELAMNATDGMSDLERAKLQADYYQVIGAYDRAVAPLEDALRADPGDLHVETALTGVFIFTNQVKRALENAKKTVVENPTQLIAWLNLAEVEVYASEPDRAAEAAEKVLGQFPHPRPHAYVYLAMAEAMRGRLAEAAAAYDKLAAVDASNAAYGRADLALAEGRLSDAEALIRAGIDADVAAKKTDDALVKRALLAEALLRQKDTSTALAAARKASAPSSAETAYLVAEVEIEAGDTKDALAISNALGKTPPQDARMFAKVIEGDALRRSGKARDAIVALGQAKDITDSWFGHLSLARAHLELAEYALAERELRECVERRGEGALAFSADAPSFRFLPPLTYYLARALEGQKRPEAKETYAAFLSQAPQGQPDPMVEDAKRRLSKL